MVTAAIQPVGVQPIDESFDSIIDSALAEVLSEMSESNIANMLNKIINKATERKGDPIETLTVESGPGGLEQKERDEEEQTEEVKKLTPQELDERRIKEEEELEKSIQDDTDAMDLRKVKKEEKLLIATRKRQVLELNERLKKYNKLTPQQKEEKSVKSENELKKLEEKKRWGGFTPEDAKELKIRTAINKWNKSLLPSNEKSENYVNQPTIKDIATKIYKIKGAREMSKDQLDSAMNLVTREKPQTERQIGFIDYITNSGYKKTTQKDINRIAKFSDLPV